MIIFLIFKIAFSGSCGPWRFDDLHYLNTTSVGVTPARLVLNSLSLSNSYNKEFLPIMQYR